MIVIFRGMLFGLAFLLSMTAHAADGDFVWARSMGGTGDDEGKAIAVDGAGNVYVMGHFKGTVDFDPSAGVYNLTSEGDRDIFLQKLDANGDFVWAHGIGGTVSDRGNGIAVDSAGNVYTTGYFSGTVDFDPGEGTFNLGFVYENLNAERFFVHKLDTDGNFLWVRDMDGHPQDMGGLEGHAGLGITVDGAGNVLTTGYIDIACYTSVHTDELECRRRIFVKKNDQDGNVVWTQSMGGNYFDQGAAIAVDHLGNVYTTGKFVGRADFDPGSGDFLLTSAGHFDNFVQKLDTSGRFVWAKSFGGGNEDASLSIAVDGTGNVFTTGKFIGRADFDPGAGTLDLSSAGFADIFIQKLEAPPDIVPANATAITPFTTGPTNSDSVSFTVTFDEAVANFDALADLTLTHTGTASTEVSITGGPITYTVTVTGISGDGSLTLAVSTASDVQDLVGNALASSVTSVAVVIDNTAPTVSIGAPTGSLVNSTGTVTYPVPVTGADSINLTSGDVTLSHSGTSGGIVVVVDGTSEAPVVEVSGVTGDGSYTINISAGIATDAAGNASEATGPSDAVLVDNTAPAFTDLVANPSEASEGNMVSIGFKSSEPIVGDPVVTVNGNPAARTDKAAFAYEYTVSSTDALGPARIEIVGTDTAGNAGTMSNSTALTILEVAMEGEGDGGAEGEGEAAADGEGEGTMEGSLEGEVEGVVEGSIEGTNEGEAEGAVEGEGATEGEGENPPAGCNGCNANGAPMQKSLGDWLAGFLGLAVLLGSYLRLQRQLDPGV